MNYHDRRRIAALSANDKLIGLRWLPFVLAAWLSFARVSFAQSSGSRTSASGATAPDSQRAVTIRPGPGSTDLSAFASRSAFYHDFNRLGNGIDLNHTYLDVMFPVMEDSNHIHRGLFWLEFPFVEAQRNLDRLPLPPGSPSPPSAVSGIGDVLFRVFAVPWYNEKKTFKALLGVDFYVPSGEGELFFSPATNAFAEESLGSGKYRIAPAVGFVWTPRPNIPIVTVYWYDASFAGDPERSNVRLGKFRIFPRYNFAFGLYVLPQLQVYTNYAHFPAAVDSLFRNTEVFFRPEVGQVLGKDETTVYIKWGIGLNDPGQINRKWGLESGFRWRF